MKEPDRNWVDLCGKVRDEVITPEEMVRLEQILSGNPDARRFYLQFMQIDSLLEKFPPLASGSELEDSLAGSRVVRIPVRSIVRWLAAAAILTLLCTLLFQSLFPPREPNDSGSPPVATLVFAEECDWSGPPLLEGQALPPQTIQLIRGTAVVRFHGGAEAVVSGKASLRLDSATSAFLENGEVVVRAEEGAEGFTLDTPSGRLIDLGTEFAVKITGEGDTELHVHEGEVAVGRDIAPENVITAGHAVKVDKSHARSKVELDAPRFQEILERANPGERRELMTAYEGFHVDAGVYEPGDLNSGKGWIGNWRLRTPEEFGIHEKDGFPNMKIAHSRMEIAWPVKGGQLGMLEMPAGQNVRIRRMKKPIEMGKWGIRYFSFLVTEPVHEPTRKENGKWNRSDMRLTFRSSDDYFGESLSFGWGRQLQPRVQGYGGQAVRSLRKIPEGQTVFCVAKVTTQKDSPDEIAFRFYTREDILDFAEPSEWDVVTREFRQDAEFDLLLLTSHSEKIRYVDEIRIGPSWRSVTPIDQKRLSPHPDS
jgi:hypothetical protein